MNLKTIVFSLCLGIFWAGGTGMAKAEEPLVRMAQIQLKPEQRDAFLAAVKEGMETAVREEPGVLALYAVADKNDANKLTFFEMYANEAAYDYHRSTPHFKKYIERTKDMAVSKVLLETAPVALCDKHNIPGAE